MEKKNIDWGSLGFNYITTDKRYVSNYKDGAWDEGVAETIRDMYGRFGIPLDPTYSGKAFRGMRSELEKDPLPGGNVLFLHTGGGPLFLDFIQTVL